MTILSAQSIRRHIEIEPFSEVGTAHGMSYGLSSCGYDLRLDKIGTMCHKQWMLRGGGFMIASVMERIVIPKNCAGLIKDKSSWARRGIAVQNTIAEPGWEGYLTIEISNHSDLPILLQKGMPICQIVFEWLDEETNLPYNGKYQNQRDIPTPAINARPIQPGYS